MEDESGAVDLNRIDTIGNDDSDANDSREEESRNPLNWRHIY